MYRWCIISKCSLKVSFIGLIYRNIYIYIYKYIYIYIYIYSSIIVREFSTGERDLVSIQVRVIPKAQKVVLDAALLNTQHYKVRIKGKVEQSRERCSALPYTSV